MKETLKPQTIIGASPLLMISCGTNKPNIITVAWAGIINSVKPMLYVSVRKERHSHSLIELNNEFVVNLVTRDLLEACDGCGILSGKNTDKFRRYNLTPVCHGLKTPVIDESPVNIECKVINKTELGSHDMFIAEIVNVLAAKEFLNDGKLDFNKANLVCYISGGYYSLGEKLGTYGFTAAKIKR